jgi:hypothetical protein
MERKIKGINFLSILYLFILNKKTKINKSD